MRRFAMLALAVAAVTVLGIGAASAQQGSTTKPFEVQAYAGSYGPGADEFDDEVTVGGRFGWRLSDGLIFEGGFGTVSLDGEFESGRSRVEFDGDLFFFDGGINWIWFPKSFVSPELFGGMGWAIADVDTSFSGPIVGVDVEGAQDDSWTLNAGVGVRVRFGESPFFLDGRWKYRWFEARESDETDRELTAAFGWEF